MSFVPLVSVWMVAYNHQNYIAQAVESVMMQQTDFNVHLFIGEDFSSDNTRIICQSLKKKYPHRISLVLNEKNLGANKNARNIYKACFNSKAKYIAMLEGDDYWTDPLKLQKQVCFLEKNSKYSGCFHNTQVLNEMERKPQIESWRTYNKNDFTLKDAISTRSLFHTSSFLFKNLNKNLPEWFSKVQSGDMALFSIIAEKGPLYRFDEDMSVYRKNPSGITNSILETSLHTNRIFLWKYFKTHCSSELYPQIDQVLSYHRKQLEEFKLIKFQGYLGKIFNFRK